MSEMDKIFKQRFENFEPKAPDSMLDDILKKAQQSEVSSTSKSLYVKTALWTAAALVAIVGAIVLLPEDNTTLSTNSNQKETVVSLPISESTNKLVEETPELLQNQDLKNNKKENTFVVNNNKSDNSNSIDKNNKEFSKVELNSSNNKANTQSKSTTDDPEQFNIVAKRYTCSGECFLTIDKEYQGEWKADNQSVSIESSNNYETVVYFKGEGSVLFSFDYEGYTDTFTVVFQKPVSLDYQMIPETCGKKDGKVEFDFPNTRQFVSVNDFQLVQNSFDKLSAGAYIFELKDNYACVYREEIELPKKEIKGTISYDAQGTMVGSSIQFRTDIDIESANYTWDFGDGQQSFEKTPEHQYGKAGIYNINLQIVSEACSTEVRLENFKIDDKGFSIPNIFTPNNDGKNDVFVISVPDDLKSFNALIMNRDGKLVYKWSDSKKGWDGLTIDGREASSGTYYYLITGVDADGKSFEYKNFVELRR